jgi:hypothetical protein
VWYDSSPSTVSGYILELQAAESSISWMIINMQDVSYFVCINTVNISIVLVHGMPQYYHLVIILRPLTRFLVFRIIS